MEITKEQEKMLTDITSTVAKEIFEENLLLTALLSGHDPDIFKDWRQRIIDILKGPVTNEEKMVCFCFGKVNESLNKIMTLILAEYMKYYQELTSTTKLKVVKKPRKPKSHDTKEK
jgi:hypothetical protein